MGTPDEQETLKAAAKIVADAMLQAGMNPARAIDHPVVQGVVRKWLQGEWTQDDVIDACEDLLRLYPELRLDDLTT